MSDWPRQSERLGLQTWVISPSHPLSLGAGIKHLMGDGTIASSVAWPAANRAILVPFRLPRMATAYQMVVGSGATASGNFDTGIYDEFGNLIVSGGSTAKGNSSETIVNITDTLLGPGLYYMALAASATGNYIGISSPQAGFLKALGVRQASTAFTLPATVTFETVAGTFLPAFSVWLKDWS